MPIIRSNRMRFDTRSVAETWLSKEGFTEQRECLWQLGQRQAFVGLVLGGRHSYVVVNFHGEG
jgi:hypothetical protein